MGSPLTLPHKAGLHVPTIEVTWNVVWRFIWELREPRKSVVHERPVEGPIWPRLLLVQAIPCPELLGEYLDPFEELALRPVVHSCPSVLGYALGVHPLGYEGLVGEEGLVGSIEEVDVEEFPVLEPNLDV